MAETSPLVNVQIDGVWHQFPKGTRVIEACAQLGVYIPRYCYHPKLSSPGNCRMCLIEMGLPRMGPDRKFESGADGKPVKTDMETALGRQRICIEIPSEINAVEQKDPALAREWRAATRWAFTESLAAGFFVAEFCRSIRGRQGPGAYLLQKGTVKEFAPDF